MDGRFTLNGSPVDITAFIAEHELDPTAIELIEALPVGGEIIYGAGAVQPETILRREA